MSPTWVPRRAFLNGPTSLLVHWLRPSYQIRNNAVRTMATDTGTRNIGIIAHIDAGKTTTTERMLFYAGVTGRIGDVDHGDTVTDFLPSERERGITIQSAAISFDWQGTRINLIDTPGHADFTFEVVRSLRVLDGAVTVLDAVAGVEAQTEKVWSQAAALRIPRILFVNKMDRAGAGFSRTVREIVSKLKTPVAMLNIPYFDETNTFRGVVDVLDQKLLVWKEGSTGEEVEVTDADGIPGAREAREALVETLSGLDDVVVNEFLEVEDHMLVSREVLAQALRKATLENKICPVLCGASFKNIGVQPLLDAIVSYLPSPRELPPVQVHQTDGLGTLDTNQVCALAFKVSHDPTRGTLVYVRVYSGTLKKGATVYNTANGSKERVTKLLQMQADSPIDINEIATGSIGVIAGTKNVRTGDTLVAHATKKDGVSSLSPADKSLALLPISIPAPVFVARISPRSVADTRGMNAALEILLREDPSLHVTYDDEVSQWLLSGMGELHLEIAQSRLVNDLKANVDVGEIVITYKETLRAPVGPVENSSTIETGHAGIKLSVGPYVANEENQVLPRQCLPDNSIFKLRVRNHPLLSREEIERACAIGLKPVLAKGGKLGRMALSSLVFDIELKISPDTTSADVISLVVRETALSAIHDADSTNFSLLEPIMRVTATAPEDTIGQVMMDITSTRRGHILGIGESSASNVDEFQRLADEMYAPLDHTMYMSKHEKQQARPSTLNASVPLRTLVGYLSSLRSMTQGRGTFQMEFERFDEAPPQDVDNILHNSPG